MRNLYGEDDEVPYFEAVYMAFFIYFMVLQGTKRVNQEDNIYYYMEKNLKLQLRVYSENSSAVLKTLITLAGIDARRGNIKKAKQMIKRIQTIEANLPDSCKELDQEEKFDLQILLAQHDENMEDGVSSLEQLAKKIEEDFKGKRNLAFWEKYYTV